jgi:hypothetical protein
MAFLKDKECTAMKSILKWSEIRFSLAKFLAEESPSRQSPDEIKLQITKRRGHLFPKEDASTKTPIPCLPSPLRFHKE